MSDLMRQRTQHNASLLVSVKECCLADALAWAGEPEVPGMDKGARLGAELERLSWVGDELVCALRADIAERKATLVRIMHDDLGLTFREVAAISGMSINRPRQVYLNRSS
jgi:hypothetical protein